MAVNKVSYYGNTLIDLTGDTVDAAHLASGYTAHDKAGNLISGIMSGGGLPSGISAIATGTYQLATATNGGKTFTVNHNLGQVPDMFIFYAPDNIAQTYSMLFAARCADFGWRGTNYQNIMYYHGNSSTTATGTNVTTSYGIKTLTASQATITTYSTSTSYYWRAGNYNWLAIKF